MLKFKGQKSHLLGIITIFGGEESVVPYNLHNHEVVVVYVNHESKI